MIEAVQYYDYIFLVFLSAFHMLWLLSTRIALQSLQFLSGNYAPYAISLICNLIIIFVSFVSLYDF